jgi:hypothetical protein
MSKSFDIKLNADPADLLVKARELAKTNGILFEGDGSTGQFAGKGIEGTYLLKQEDMLCVSISKKPMILPWSLIETTMRKMFA